MSTFLQSGLGVPKTDMFQILYCTEMEKQVQFEARCCQKYTLYEKRLQIKVAEY